MVLSGFSFLLWNAHTTSSLRVWNQLAFPGGPGSPHDLPSPGAVGPGGPGHVRVPTETLIEPPRGMGRNPIGAPAMTSSTSPEISMEQVLESIRIPSEEAGRTDCISREGPDT